jgi:hypothetical protein
VVIKAAGCEVLKRLNNLPEIIAGQKRLNVCEQTKKPDKNFPI